MNTDGYIPNDCPIPPLYGTEGIELDDKVVWVKLTSPGFTFYLVEYSPTAPDDTPSLAFGYVRNETEPYFSEWGYISIQELIETQISGIPLVKRDTRWEPKPFGQIKF